jgi:hypothetical protein
MEKIGLLAGTGRLPLEFAAAAAKLNFTVCAVGLVEGVEPTLADTVDKYKRIDAGQLAAVIEFFKENNVTKITMLGKITKELLFNGSVELDEMTRRLFQELPDNSDDTLMFAFVRAFALAGITVFDQTALIKSLLVREGVLTEREPSDSEKKDMDFGFQMAKAIGGLDIGQTVVVKDRAVMAVEAIEGTDACILRGGKLACGGAVVVKVAKPKQDIRFDMPTVGVGTIEAMIATGAKALAMEAGRTLLVDKAKVIELADENGITIAAI